MKAYKIIVTGKVQGVGFRRNVQELARKIGVAGQVSNLEDGNVEILVRAEDKNIDRFLNSIKQLELPVRVENIVKHPARVSVKMKSFKIKHGSITEELDEGLGAGQEQLTLLRKEFSSFSTNTADNFGTLASRYDKISDVLGILTTQTKEFKEALVTLTDLAKQYFDERRDERSGKAGR